jgi:hypothetical protein
VRPATQTTEAHSETGFGAFHVPLNLKQLSVSQSKFSGATKKFMYNEFKLLRHKYGTLKDVAIIVIKCCLFNKLFKHHHEKSNTMFAYKINSGMPRGGVSTPHPIILEY